MIKWNLGSRSEVIGQGWDTKSGLERGHFDRFHGEDEVRLL